MKLHNLYSRLLRGLALGATLGFLAATVTAADSVPAAAATADSANGYALDVTPEALSTSHRVVKLNMARWIDGARLIQPQANGDLKTVVFDEYAAAKFAAIAKDPQAAPSLGALLEDDATVQVPFAKGDSSMIVDIGITHTLERFGFFSFSAAGSVDIYYSVDSPKSAKPDDKSWQSANIHQTFASRRIVNVDLKALDTRYVLLVFKITTPGAIGPIALFTSVDLKHPIAAPNQEDENGKVKIVPPDDLVEFDYAQSAYGSKVSHVIGGNVSDAQNVLDSDPSKSLTLGASTDQPNAKPENIFVVDMGQKRDISKVGLLFSTSGNGNFAFYFLDTLPTKPKDTTTGFNEYLRLPHPILLASNDNAMARALFLAAEGDGTPPAVQQVDYLPPNFFSANKPGFTQNINGDNNNGRIAGIFDNTMKFRYALIHWVPADPNQPPVDVFRVNLIGNVPLEDFGQASKDSVNALDPTGFLQPAVTPSTPPGVGLTGNPPDNTPTTPTPPPTTEPPPTSPPTNNPPTPNNNPPVSS